MNWNRWIRQTHRWLSIAFVIIVLIVTFAAVGPEQPAEWVFYLPLPPLFLLIFTGLYLFVLPYLTRRRSGQHID
jgi:ABC-type polysaccharide/polyol phosphate export permease